MFNKILTSSEQKILETRGFYVKKLPFSVQSFVIDSFILLFVFCLSIVLGLGIGYILNIVDFFLIFLGGITGILIVKGVHNYITNNRVYFLKDQILWNGYLQNLGEGNVSFINEYGYIFSDLPRHFPSLRGSAILRNFPSFIEGTLGKGDESGKIIFLVFLLAAPVLGPLFVYPNVAIVTIFALVVPVILRQFNSTFRFGKYATSLQKLTGTFLSQVEDIKKNFVGNLNLSLLKKDFTQFSNSFSHIFSLLIRLEGVESKMDKGDFFDTNKYINSLRSDIIEPLQSLKSFLEKQREELLFSQNELQKVRVGGPSELTMQSELASKRSEPIIAELTENIEKLDEMIGKMG